MTRRKRAPAKRKFHKRDKEVGKLLHKNIERLAAAKALKNEESSRCSICWESAKEQLALEKEKQERRSARARIL